MATPKRICLMVLGMHRSGTSALTRLISLLGASLPKQLVGANPTNPTGHWEPQRILDVNDRMLAENGSSWDDWRTFDPRDLGDDRYDAYLAEATQILSEEYEGSPLFVLKEPRICRMVPFYTDAFKKLGVDVRYVLVNRNPLSIGLSLEKRDKFSLEFSYLLWLRCQLDAEFATRGGNRTILSYEELLNDWRPWLARLVDTSDIDWPRDLNDVAPEIDAFLSREHEHHAASLEALLADPRVPQLVKDAGQAFAQLAASPQDQSVLASLDRIRADFEQISDVAGNAAFPEMMRRTHELQKASAQQVEARDTLVAGQEGQIAILTAAAAEQEAQIATLTTAAAEQDAQIATLTTAAAEQDGQIAEFTTAIAEKDEQVAGLKTALVRKDGQVTAWRTAAADKDDQLAKLADEVKKLSDDNTAMMDEFRQRESRYLSDLNAIHFAYQKSMSWKLTGPVRSLRQMSTMLTKQAPAFIARNGGVISASKKAVRIIHNQGFSTLNRRRIHAAAEAAKMSAVPSTVVDQVQETTSVASEGSAILVRSRFFDDLLRWDRQPAQPVFKDLDPTCLNITWVIPDFLPGAGGHMTIFRIAHYLEKFGHKVSFVIQNPSVHAKASSAKYTINTHFQPFAGEVILLSKDLPDLSGDALIATDRFTCFPVNAMSGFRRKFYFVQDLETQFYPMGAEALISDYTYKFDFDCLTAGDWLQDKMMGFGRWAQSWPLAFDPSKYFIDPKVDRRPNSIAFYARYVTPRRAVELGMMALDLLHARGVDFHVDFFGYDVGNLDVGYKYVNHGLVDQDKLGDLYRKSEIGVVFSATNHSLVNKEMMACGLPVIDLDVESVRGVFPKETLAFAVPGPTGIADALESLLSDSSKRQKLRKAGLEFVQDLSWEGSARIVERALIDRIVNGPKQSEVDF